MLINSPTSEILDFDRPFKAGQLATVHPGSLAFDYTVTFEQLLSIHAEIKSFGFSKQKLDEKELRNVMNSASGRVIDCIGAIAHEKDHVRRFQSTTYGFLCDEIRCRIIRQLAQILADVGFDSFQRLNSANRMSFLTKRAMAHDELAQTDQAFEPLVELYRLHVLYESLTDLNPGLRYRTWLMGTEGKPSNHDSTETIPSATFSTVVTTRHILEMFAILEHGNGLSRRSCPTDLVQQLLDAMSGEYRQLIEVWHSAFRTSPLAPITQQLRHKDDLGFDWYRMCHFEFYVAADLALWPPFFPVQGPIFDSGYSWHDLSPVSRFVKILTYWEKSGLTPRAIPAESRNEQFLELQDNVCRHFRWPTPAHLATKWRVHLEQKLHEGLSSWQALDGSTLRRMQMAVQLLSIRESRPSDLVLNNIDFRTYKIDRPLVWVFPDPDGRRYPVPTQKNDEAADLPYIVTEIANHMIVRDRIILTDQMHRQFRERAILQFTEHMAMIGSWTEARRVDISQGLTSEMDRYDRVMNSSR